VVAWSRVAAEGPWLFAIAVVAWFVMVTIGRVVVVEEVEQYEKKFAVVDQMVKGLKMWSEECYEEEEEKYDE